MATCKCGKRMSKYSINCKECHQKNMENSARNFVKVAISGKCPSCENELVENISLAGSRWLQCRGFGRHKRGPQDKDCNFQILADYDLVNEILAERKELVPEAFGVNNLI